MKIRKKESGSSTENGPVGCASEQRSCPAGPPRFKTAPGTEISSIIAVMSGKGGVGKSSVTMMTAVELRRMGFEVGILDADITGPSVPKGLGVIGPIVVGDEGPVPSTSLTGIRVMSMNLILSNEDDAVVWRGPLISNAVRQFYEECQWGRLDFLLVDLPPGTADVPLTIMQSIPLDGIILVTSPQELASVIVGKAVNMASLLSAPVTGLIENMSFVTCDSCGTRLEPFGPSHGEEAAAQMGTALLGRLPLDRRISEFADAGRMEEYESEAVRETVGNILSRLGKAGGNGNRATQVWKEKRMKVAIVMAGSEVSPHFGRAEEFMLVEVDDGEIKEREVLLAPAHECGALPALLSERGVDCLIAGGIGAGAIQHLAGAGIQVYSGAEGSVEDALGRLLAGTLTSSGDVCGGEMGTCGHGEHDCGH